MSQPPQNPGVPKLPYFTPLHIDNPGTLLPAKNVTSKAPTLFTPIKIRGTTLRNRIIVAPMCQYSTASSGPQIGALTDYHLVTLGHYALKGAGLVFVEASGVQPNGRISPNCPGIWSDDQIPALKRVADFIKSQGSVAGIQLAHAGRKASTMPPWITARAPGARKISLRAPKESGGWPQDVVGPMSGEEWSWDGKSSTDPSGGFWAPRALSEAEIKEFVADWGRAAKRSIEAGVQVIEIHAAHGYGIHQFLSPVTNQRMDKYGGSFENRTRILVEVIQEVRKNIPEETPLFLRISSTEWLEQTEIGKKYGSWDVESSIELAKMLPGLGVDLLDVSSGGNHPSQQINMFDSKDYQIRIAARIRTALKADNKSLLIGAVGLITEAVQARDIVEEGGAAAGLNDGNGGSEIAQEARAAVRMTDAQDGKQPQADVILVARQFMREPEWVLRIAHKLGIEVAWPSQFLRVKFPKL